MKDKEKSFTINFVHKNIIHNENIRKEQKYEAKNLKYEYTFSPFNCKVIICEFELNFISITYLVFPIAEKPNTVKPNRPFTTQEVVTKLSNRENKINVDPICKDYNYNDATY
jgi:hypothetical protein